MMLHKTPSPASRRRHLEPAASVIAMRQVITRTAVLRCMTVGAALAIAGACAAKPVEATLGADEREQGFESLFDGSSLAGWHLYRKPGQAVTGWQVIDGAITRTSAGGDLVSDREYGDFDLRMEWKISPGGNSGIFYRGDESQPAIYWTAIEYQVLDNERHPDGRNGKDRWASAVYGMYPPTSVATRPVGEWNQARIVARGAHVEHWLNGVKVADYELWTPAWKARVAQTKFKDWPGYGMAPKGHIGLQDHGDEVSYRKIRIREL